MSTSHKDIAHTIDPDIFSSSLEYKKRFSGTTGSWLLSKQNEIVKNFIDLLPIKPENVLDIGGGHGQLIESFLDKKIRITLHATNSICFNNISQYSDKIENFVVSPLDKLPFDDQTFDLVTAVRMLPHILNWRVFLSELCRVSKGAIILDYVPTLSLNILTPLLFRFKKKIEGNTRPYFYHRAGEIKLHFGDQGFSLLKDKAQLFIPMAFHRFLAKKRLSEFLELPFQLTGITQMIGSPRIILVRKTKNV